MVLYIVTGCCLLFLLWVHVDSCFVSYGAWCFFSLPTELGASLSDLRIYNGIGDISLFTTLVWHSILSCRGVLGGNSGIQNDPFYTLGCIPIFLFHLFSISFALLHLL